MASPCKRARSSEYCQRHGREPYFRRSDFVATSLKNYIIFTEFQLSPKCSRYFFRRLASFVEAFCVREYWKSLRPALESVFESLHRVAMGEWSCISNLENREFLSRRSATIGSGLSRRSGSSCCQSRLCGIPY